MPLSAAHPRPSPPIDAQNDGQMIFEALSAAQEPESDLGFRGVPWDRTVDLLITMRVKRAEGALRVGATCSLPLCRDVTSVTFRERDMPQDAAKTCGQPAVKRS